MRISDWSSDVCSSDLGLVRDTLNQERPVLPAAHQVFAELWATTVGKPVTSKRSLVYHGWITLSSTLLGFAIGTGLGIVLAVLIVHNRAVDRSLMPWVVASQTIPILAIAPMIIVVLNAVGLSGLLPKADRKSTRLNSSNSCATRMTACA